MPFPAEIRRIRQITTLKYSLTSYPLFFNMNRKKKTVKNKIAKQKIPIEKERPGIFMLDYLNAFWVGGLICVIGQILIDKTKLTPARILVTFVVLGVALTAVGLYKPLVEFAGAGATVPLSGFGYTMAEGIKKAVTAHGLLGVLSGGIAAAAAGITAAIVFGLVGALIAKPKEKD